MVLFELDPLRDPRWVQFVGTAPRASVFHSEGWLQALNQTYGYVPTVVTSSAPGEPLQNGMVFCKVRSWLTGRRLVSLPFSDHCDPLSMSPAELLAIVEWSKQSREDWKYLEIRPRGPLPSAISNGAMFGPFPPYFLHTLDLRPSLGDLLKGFHKSSVQRRIQRAERENLRYEAGNTEEMIRAFYAIFSLSRQRQMAPPQPIEWFLNLARLLKERMQVRTVSFDGKPIASIITLQYGKAMVYKYGCSDPEFHNLGGMPLLLWHAIREAKERQLEEFDFGRTASDNDGLLCFKDRWGTTRSTLTYWRYPPLQAGAAGPRWERVRTVAQKMLARCPGFLFNLSGRLLYRHIG